MTDGIGHGELIRSEFEPARWLRNRHLQTIFPSLPWPKEPRLPLTRRALPLPDGDVTVVDWLADLPEDGTNVPLLIILHGLEGSAQSTYARGLLQAAREQGWNAAVLHFRDCGDYRNLLPRRYHAGETNDLRYFLNKLRTEGQHGPMFAAGYSLGGNVLLKYLGEETSATPLQAAAAVCVPLNLHVSARALSEGFSRLYQKYLLKRMRKAVNRKFDRFTAAFDWDRAMGARTFAEFDDAVTAPLHGFRDKDEYYDKCSSLQFLPSIERPTLIINSKDDPFMTPDVLPGESGLAPLVTLEVSDFGGHVGFVAGGPPWRPRYYLPRRIVEFLDTQLEDSGDEPHALPAM
ncbi:MAG: hydrolase [Gammaproteobacteria bacterium]|nr:hydrolase [Gammaproteobacteria bacterium]MDH4255375.1 hydrolase [Gammaproteobacteria bacterium]MDH5261380.1 hydrolase [Gammaproteobacteria bacterium]